MLLGKSKRLTYTNKDGKKSKYNYHVKGIIAFDILG